MMTELRDEHLEVISRNKAIAYDKENSNKLIKAQEIYNRTNGLQNISEHELKKFNELMKYKL
jgi:hypothetical protein|tara:strand:+ start:264 stop:449 length:186 start_codon:yes stop_codon:yes gene_type:complete